MAHQVQLPARLLLLRHEHILPRCAPAAGSLSCGLGRRDLPFLLLVARGRSVRGFPRQLPPTETAPGRLPPRTLAAAAGPAAAAAALGQLQPHKALAREAFPLPAAHAQVDERSIHLQRQGGGGGMQSMRRALVGDPFAPGCMQQGALDAA